MTHVFVTASGTDVGKTVISALLLRQLVAKGVRVEALKPVLSGLEGTSWDETDTGRLITALGEEITEAGVERVTPWRFDPPLSPDMAADRVGQKLELQELTDFCLTPKDKDVVLVEGAGGVLVPINPVATMADWMQALDAQTDLKVLLVVGSYLGSISHTLTAMESLSARGLGPAAIIISTSEVNPVPVEETATVMARFAGDIPIAIVPRFQNTDGVNEDAPDLTQYVV
jgi:dethiobiotin synthetase